jgi:hypothetical protein
MSASIASGAVIFFKMGSFGRAPKKIETVKGKARFISELQYYWVGAVATSSANATSTNAEARMRRPFRLSFSHFFWLLWPGWLAGPWLLASGC